MPDWLLHCNPDVWDVFAWWEDGGGDLGVWTVSRHLKDLQPGDRFAFWIGGREAGVYALGRIASVPYPVPKVSGGYWKRPPRGPTHMVDLTTERYLFDAPIRKRELANDRGFADALIIRMPRAGNPMLLTTRQWRAIERRVPSHERGTARRPSTRPVVMERALGSVMETTTVTPPKAARTRRYREGALVKRYEKYLRRPLSVLSVVLPSGERLVCDGYDRKEDRLIEAKASNSREDMRMAIGQLMDYRRHLAPKAKLAVLVPSYPSADLAALVSELGIELIHERGKSRFAVVRPSTSRR